MNHTQEIKEKPLKRPYGMMGLLPPREKSLKRPYGLMGLLLPREKPLKRPYGLMGLFPPPEQKPFAPQWMGDEKPDKAYFQRVRKRIRERTLLIQARVKSALRAIVRKAFNLLSTCGARRGKRQRRERRILRIVGSRDSPHPLGYNLKASEYGGFNGSI